jgi:hypothetical protein
MTLELSADQAQAVLDNFRSRMRSLRPRRGKSRADHLEQGLRIGGPDEERSPEGLGHGPGLRLQVDRGPKHQPRLDRYGVGLQRGSEPTRINARREKLDDHNVRIVGSDDLQRVLAVRGFEHAMAALLEQRRQETAIDRAVLDDEYGCHGRRCLRVVIEPVK